jgi:hypothetical protein
MGNSSQITHLVSAPYLNPTMGNSLQIPHLVSAPYLNPTMGNSLQILHLAWCFAVSAAASLCNTGSHTKDWGSNLNHSIKWETCSSGRPLACN